LNGEHSDQFGLASGDTLRPFFRFCPHLRYDERKGEFTLWQKAQPPQPHRKPRRTNAVSSQNLTIQRTSRGLITITGDQNELGPIIEALMRGNSGGTQARATRRRRRTVARKQPELANQATPAPQATKRRGRPSGQAY
jgi:hypothetical protein